MAHTDLTDLTGLPKWALNPTKIPTWRIVAHTDPTDLTDLTDLTGLPKWALNSTKIPTWWIVAHTDPTGLL